MSKHLTPATFQGEARKLEMAVALIAVDIKARFHQQTVSELMNLGLPVEIASPHSLYLFE